MKGAAGTIQKFRTLVNSRFILTMIYGCVIFVCKIN
jgi:hypothetical protein